MKIDLNLFREELARLCQGESIATREYPIAKNGKSIAYVGKGLKSAVRADKKQGVAFKMRFTDNNITVILNPSRIRSSKKIAGYMDAMRQALNF